MYKIQIDMTMIEIKQSINDKISEINLSFARVGKTKFTGVISFFNNNYIGIHDNDCEKLEEILKTVTKLYNRSNVASYIFSVLVLIALVFKQNPSFDFFSTSLFGLICVCIISYINKFHYYKLKNNVDNKIYLLKLLDSFDKIK